MSIGRVHEFGFSSSMSEEMGVTIVVGRGGVIMGFGGNVIIWNSIEVEIMVLSE